MPGIKANGIEIAYESFGAADAEPMLLLPGMGAQILRWTAPFCEMLAAQGYRVIRLDNRDSGLSTHFTAAPFPDLAALTAALVRGERPQVPYTLHDMAADTIGLMDALGIERAHLAGRSLGGMIAQIVAAKHPQRVRSLTAIMSSTGNPSLPPPGPEAMAVLMKKPPNPFDDEEGYLAHSAAVAKALGSPGYPFDAATQRELAIAELRRAYDPSGAGRQIAAIAATGDLRPLIRNIMLPVLVIHGAHDPLIPPACGKDIAQNIAHAVLMVLDGMGHEVPAPLFDTVADAIVRNARRAA